MKNFFYSALTAASLFSFLLLLSCQKEVGSSTKSEIAGKVKPDKEYNKCEIESITVLDPLFPHHSAVFEYNQHGDPTFTRQ